MIVIDDTNTQSTVMITFNEFNLEEVILGDGLITKLFFQCVL